MFSVANRMTRGSVMGLFTHFALRAVAATQMAVLLLDPRGTAGFNRPALAWLGESLAYTVPGLPLWRADGVHGGAFSVRGRPRARCLAGP